MRVATRDIAISTGRDTPNGAQTKRAPKLRDVRARNRAHAYDSRPAAGASDGAARAAARLELVPHASAGRDADWRSKAARNRLKVRDQPALGSRRYASPESRESLLA